jgi:uncharacterized damage-inducible protein DinB
MNSEHFLNMWIYNEWANRHILTTAARLPPDKYTTAVSSSFGSLRGTLVHIYGAELVWRLRCQDGASPAGLPSQDTFPGLESLRTVWENEMQRMRAFIQGFSAAEFDTEIAYTTSKGVPCVSPLWQIVAHLVNHGTQFRSEAGMIMNTWGVSPGDMDLIFFFREK